MKIFIQLLLVVLFSISAQGNMMEADRAYENKEYSKAFSIYLNHAENAKARAQIKVSLMYFHGKGVKKHKRKSRVWMKKAAKQGSSFAKKFLKEKFSSTGTNNIKRYSLKINAPHGAKIKILNIKAKYRDNIKLKAKSWKI